jgi:hypothetical protein
LEYLHNFSLKLLVLSKSSNFSIKYYGITESLMKGILFFQAGVGFNLFCGETANPYDIKSDLKGLMYVNIFFNGEKANPFITRIL